MKTMLDSMLKLSRLFVITVAAGASVLMLNSCGCVIGKGPVARVERNIDPGTQLVIDVPAEVILSQTDKPMLAITTHPNLQQYIKVSRNGDKITLKSSRCIENAGNVIIELGMPDFTSLNIKVPAKVRTAGKRIDVEKFELNVGDALAVSLNISTIDMVINTSGPANLMLNGFSRSLHLSQQGPGQVRAIGFPVSTAECSLKGPGITQLQVQKTLLADVAKGATLEYLGASGIEAKISGEGKATQLK